MSVESTHLKERESESVHIIRKAVAGSEAPYRADREAVRAKHEDIGLHFVEVFVDTPLDLCETRDPKGLYACARAGDITGMIGVDDPYEAPPAPDIAVDGARVSEAAASVLEGIGK